MAQVIEDVILFFALLAAIWYSWETRKMRRQMIRPKVVFLTSPHHPEHQQDTQSVDLVIQNVGDGAAINIAIDRVQDKSFRLQFAPEHIPILQKGEQITLAMLPVEGTYKPDMTTILDDSAISVKMVARYVDVEGSEFRTSAAVGGGAKPPFIKDE